MDRSRVEISRAALRANVRTLRAIAGADRILCAVVKANAYGHGICEVAEVLACARAFHATPSRGGGEIRGWFGVDSMSEVEVLRGIGIPQPILVLGYVPIADARAAVRAGVRVTVAMPETVRALAAAARSLRRTVAVHVKVETGTQRQGVPLRDLPAFLRMIERARGLTLEGISTHLADVEDTGPDGFATVQCERFERAVAVAERCAGRRLLRHASASAATLLLPNARFDLVRTGIALYGLWPSDRVRDVMARRDRAFQLHPVLTWKTIVGPMHWVSAGAPVGYGCTERARRRTRIAVLPVGYWDGYDRKLSSIGAVLIRGKRCKVIGRVCMNMCMVDVTDVPRARSRTHQTGAAKKTYGRMGHLQRVDARGVLEEEVVLLGRQGREEVTAEELAGKIGTINYEVVTRINPLLPRRVV